MLRTEDKDAYFIQYEWPSKGARATESSRGVCCRVVYARIVLVRRDGGDGPT